MSSFSSGRGSREEQYLVETASLPNQVETRNSEDLADLEDQQGLEAEGSGDCKHQSLSTRILVLAFTCCVYSAAAAVAVVCYFAFLGLQQVTFAMGWAVASGAGGSEWRDLDSEGSFLVASTSLQLVLYAVMAGRYFFGVYVRGTVLSTRLERWSYALLSLVALPCMGLAIAFLSIGCFSWRPRQPEPGSEASQLGLLCVGMVAQTGATAAVIGFWILQVKDYEFITMKQP